MQPVMGRRAKATSKTTLDIDPKLKERAILWAVRHGATLTEMVERGLRLVMAQGSKS
jgi:hypothetical protein